MNSKMYRLLFALAAGVALQGCIAFPPLIQVEHKDAPQNQQELIKRLDAIDHRLDALEHQAGK
jgi:starvation-inducible outer membrane lipoprotein